MPQSIGKALFLTPPLCCGGHHCRIFRKKGFFSWPFLGFHIYFIIPLVSLTQKNGRSPWLAPFCCFVRNISYRKLRAHGCRGSCGLVGLGWEHAKTMCMCIPPSKTQRDTNPTPDSVWTSAPVVKTCWRPAVLILGRRESSRN